jgi:hypothetical protein
MKTPDFTDRLGAASAATKAQLERARAIAEDPERLQRLKARTEIVAARKARFAEREATLRAANEGEAAELAGAQAAEAAAHEAARKAAEEARAARLAAQAAKEAAAAVRGAPCGPQSKPQKKEAPRALERQFQCSSHGSRCDGVIVTDFQNRTEMIDVLISRSIIAGEMTIGFEEDT